MGKTFAMLNEGRRRAERGTDVVVAVVETHGRAKTAEQVGDLEIVPRAEHIHRGARFEELDLDAVLARHPEVALVDELAHTNVPGSRHAKRWQDVEELLAAGIEVITTVNIQHLESVNDVVQRITGVEQLETVPDHVVRRADQVELVDMTPEALRRRMAHGNVYGAEKIDAALTNYFREGNLAALRELALLWVADQVDVALEEYRVRHDITEPWETRERVVVAVTGAVGSEALVRRAARLAQRAHAELLGLHVRDQDGLAGPPDEGLAAHRRLLEELGGRYQETAGSDVAAALVSFAQSENATQIVLGASQRSRWHELTQGSVINRVVRLSGTIDVHVVSQGGADSSPAGVLPKMPLARRSPVPPRRRVLGWLLAGFGLPLLTAGLVPWRADVGLSTVLVTFLLLVVLSAALGGIGPALVAAVAGSLLVNWFFTPPLHTFTIGDSDNLVALGAFLVTGVVVSGFMTTATRRSAEAARAGAEAETLSALSGGIVEVDPLPTLLAHLRTAFAMTGAALLARTEDGWRTEAAAGVAVTVPGDADEVHEVDPNLVLALSGRHLLPEDRRVLDAFVAHLAAALERRQLQERAVEAATLAEADELRSALLQAVSHDLRTPLAGIKASVDSLRQPDVTWSPEQTEEFLTTVGDETDRLITLVENLLDMSRLNAGAVVLSTRPTHLDEVVPLALAGLGARAQTVEIDIAESFPPVRADPDLLERVVANLVDNALTHGQAEHPVRVEAGVVAGRVLLRVIDRGRGIARTDRQRIFEPFQRQGDQVPRAGAGVGLGLAVARGFTRAMLGELHVEDTPGGGTTMVLDLEVAA